MATMEVPKETDGCYCQKCGIPVDPTDEKCPNGHVLAEVGRAYLISASGSIKFTADAVLVAHKTRCFIIMPFSETKNHSETFWTKHFEFFLKPIIEEIDNVEVFRSEALRGAITTDIIKDLIFSDIVIADITDYNPNVFWELGVRQSFTHRTIIIAENGTKPPFDIKDKGVLFYDSDHLDVDNFKSKLHETIKDCISNPERPDSPVLEAITGRGSLYYLLHKDEIMRMTWAVLRECVINNRTIGELYTRLEEYKEKPISERLAPWGQILRFASLENLSVNRYLDISIELYADVNSYIIKIKEVNMLTEGLRHADAYDHAVEILYVIKDELMKLSQKVSVSLSDVYETFPEIRMRES